MRYFAAILFVAFVAQPSHQRHVSYNDASFEPEAYSDTSDTDGVVVYDDIADGQEYDPREHFRKRATVVRPVPEVTSQYNPETPVDALKDAGLHRFQNEEVFRAMLEELVREHLTNYQERRNPVWLSDLTGRQSREVFPTELDWEVLEHRWNHQQRRNPVSNISEQRYRRNPFHGADLILRASREVFSTELDRVPRQGFWDLLPRPPGFPPRYNF